MDKMRTEDVRIVSGGIKNLFDNDIDLEALYNLLNIRKLTGFIPLTRPYGINREQATEPCHP
jgi:hypothetical protein